MENKWRPMDAPLMLYIHKNLYNPPQENNPPPPKGIIGSLKVKSTNH